MKELEKEFIGRGEVRGFIFTQLIKNEYGYIYQVSNNGNIYFEVFRRKENTQFNCISYPKSPAFGIWAWSKTTFEDAQNILNEITQQSEINAF